VASVRRREVDLRVTPPFAQMRVVAALASLGLILEPMWAPGMIRALRPTNLASWGSDVTVWLVAMPYGTRAFIESRPTARPIGLDWGINQHNVDRIAEMITADPPAPDRGPVDAATPQDRVPTDA
jgi:hypothetical protein